MKKNQKEVKMPQAVVPTMRFEDLFLGWEAPPSYWAVTETELKMFAAAIGCNDPVYSDVEAAQKAGFPSIIAHPGFVNVWHFEPALLRSLNNNPVFPTMHNRTTLELHAPIFAGDMITCRIKVHDLTVSSKGKKFASWNIELYNGKGELVARKIHSSQWLSAWPNTKSGPRPLY
jgi:acyl dehydratase